MASASPTQSNRSKSVRKSKRQKQGRRKLSLMKKAAEYSKMCDADVCVGIRLRETGQVFILSADASGFWAFLGSQLVCFQLCLRWKVDWPIKNSYYPAPKLVTDQDLELVDKDTPEQHTWSHGGTSIRLEALQLIQRLKTTIYGFFLIVQVTERKAR